MCHNVTPEKLLKIKDVHKASALQGVNPDSQRLTLAWESGKGLLPQSLTPASPSAQRLHDLGHQAVLPTSWTVSISEFIALSWTKMQRKMVAFRGS